MIGWLLFILLLAGIGVIAWGAFNIQGNFFLKAIHRGDTANRQIALTFDDGPHPVYTPQVLNLLDQYNAGATFFCIGRNVEQHPEAVKQICAAGHMVGNHSFTHAHAIDFHSQAKWLEELRQADAAIARAIGSTPRFFRPPYGVTTPHLAKAIKVTGHTVIGWRVRPYDTLKSRSPEYVARAVLRKVEPGDIILLHDTHDRVVPILEQLLPELEKRRFTMVTAEKLIQQHAYTET